MGSSRCCISAIYYGVNIIASYGVCEFGSYTQAIARDAVFGVVSDKTNLAWCNGCCCIGLSRARERVVGTTEFCPFESQLYRLVLTCGCIAKLSYGGIVSKFDRAVVLRQNA